MSTEPNVFRYQDNRSPYYYCLYTHPLTGKQAAFSCKTADLVEAISYAKKRLPEVLKRCLMPKQSRRQSPPETQSQRLPTTDILLSEFAEQYIESRTT